MTVVTSTIRLGTRGSALARAQAEQVAAALGERIGRTVELVEVSTTGDRSADALDALSGTGVFVTALRERLLHGDVDIAVHSLKDLPTAPAEGVVLAAVPVRADPRDALVASDARTLADLPGGARVGTGSPRRVAQLRALGLGLDVVPIRGNVDTRLRMVAEGRYDAVVVALAGLIRLGRDDEASEVLDPMQMLPAPGQGALAVECRAGDRAVIEALSGLDHPVTRAAVTAERELLAALEAGCTAPVGALADVTFDESEPELYLRAVVTSPTGDASVRLSLTGPAADAARLGRQLAGDLLEAGASDLMEST